MPPPQLLRDQKTFWAKQRDFEIPDIDGRGYDGLDFDRKPIQSVYDGVRGNAPN